MVITRPEDLGFSAKRLARIHPYLCKYIEQGTIAGMIALVARSGKVVFHDMVGMMDNAAGKPMQADAIFRIYSMSKPITSVAVMMLMEEGRIRLYDPISRYIPEFKEMKVIARKAEEGVELEEARRPITIRDLLTHTAGLSYGFNENDYLDGLYREHLWKMMDADPEINIEKVVKKIAELPLAFHPGTAFNYSFSIDVLGYLVQIISGLPFDVFLKQRICEPLGMIDTGFWVPPEKVDRFAKNYGPKVVDGVPQYNQLVDIDPVDQSPYYAPVQFLSGGGGLVSTTSDYLRFCQMLLNGGELDGTRLLGRKTVELMILNHLPDGIYQNIHQNAEHAYGFGLGGFVLLDPAKAQILGTKGTWGWGGAANTKFWIDFQEQVIGLLMLQYMPCDFYPLENDYRNLVYQAMIG